MLGLVDGDIIVFRCGFAAERKEWHLHVPKDKNGESYTGVFEYKREALDKLDQLLPGKYSRQEGEDYKLFPEVNLEPLSHALQNVKTLMKQVADACGLNEFDLRVFLSSGENFRHRVAKTRPYKGNRDRTHRPAYEQEIKDYIKENYDTYVGDDEEADDLMGIWQTKHGPHGAIIISLDKDLDQIPGLKYNWLHDVSYDVDENKAWYNFFMQLLTGDSTDNIPGLPGIGPGKAAKALHGLEDDPHAMMEECIRQYQMHSRKEDWLEYMKEQGQLVYIRRKEGEMWEPPIDLEDPWFVDQGIGNEISMY